MDAISLSPIDDFIKEAGDAQWAAFLPDVEPELATPEEREELFQELHKIAKESFHAELHLYAESDEMAKWASEDISEDELDEQIFLVASSLTGEEINKLAQVESFVELEEQQFEQMYEDTLQDLHGIAKEAFLVEIRNALSDDDELVKQALAVADEMDFDTSLAKLAADGGYALTKEAIRGTLGKLWGWGGKQVSKGGRSLFREAPKGTMGWTQRLQAGIGSRMQQAGMGMRRQGRQYQVNAKRWAGERAANRAARAARNRAGTDAGTRWFQSGGMPAGIMRSGGSLAVDAARAVSRQPRAWLASKQGQLRGALTSKPIMPMTPIPAGATGEALARGQRVNLAKSEAAFTRDIRAAKQVGDTARAQELVAGRAQWRALPQDARAAALIENPAMFGMRTPNRRYADLVTARQGYGTQVGRTQTAAQRATADAARVEQAAVSEMRAANPALTEAQATAQVRAGATGSPGTLAGTGGGAGGANLSEWFKAQSTPVQLGLGAAGVLGGRKLLVD